MVQIKVTGKRSNKNKIKKATLAVANSLGIDVDVNLRFMEHESPDKYGFAAEIMGAQYICIFKDCPDSELGKVISHEMIHVWQNVRGDLKFDYDNMIFYWKGKKYTQNDLDQMKYYDRPWEAEAKKLEKDLAQDFFMS